MKIFTALTVAALLVLSLPLLSEENGSDNVKLSATKIERGPVFDGQLDEEAWAQAIPFTSFKMIFPTAGNEPTEKTELRLLYDRDHLYIGLICFDSQPSKIAGNTMAHDAAGDFDEGNDDVVKVLLDPFLDKRTAYVFYVNARGARSEGLAFGEHASLDWDGIWDAKARLRPDGWSAEMKIPFKTISFKPGLASWGLNVERTIPRKQETIRLSGISPDSLFNNPAEAASLEGIEGIRQGLGFTFRPYGTVSVVKDHSAGADADWRIDGGFDLYKNFTPNLVGAFSYNTDFAETEVDERRINLTRFPLFFPEKRTFFLEGSEIFNFGTNREDFIPFFSRRLGLYRGEQVPVNFGAKVYGKLGKTSLSFLDVQTGALAGDGLSSQNFFAGRVYQNVLAESKVGLIFTSGSPTGERNTLLGFDFNYQTSKFLGRRNFIVGGWYVYNWNALKAGHHQGYGFKVDYPNDLWDTYLAYNYFGDSLNPGMGFISRPGVQEMSFNLSYQPRPKKTGFIGRAVRQFEHEVGGSFFWDLQGRLQTRELHIVPLGVALESGDFFAVSIQPTRDILPFDFEVADGVILPKGPYDFAEVELGFHSAGYRPYGFDVEYDFGSFYSGHLKKLEIGFSLKFKGFATLGVSTELVRGDLPQGKFNENIYELKADFFLSPDLGLMNYIQYDDVSRELGVNIRLRWQVSPGNIIYFVYAKDWERRWDPLSRFVPLEEKGVFKIQLSLRP